MEAQVAELVSDDAMQSASEIFQQVRRRLFGIAYRMLGSVADAEDILQETWIRWQRTDRAEVDEPAAFLATITTRLAINSLQSAHSRRETYIGPWLPEPVNTEEDPSLGAEKAEALSFAMLLLLEKLTPTERAAYVLREAFDYPYEHIAEIVGSSPAAARQLVSRARKHIASERHVEAPAPAQRRLLETFLDAARRGATAELEALFAEDIVSYTDGNGVKLAARIPVAGVARVAKFIAAFSSHFWTGKQIGWVELNGQPALTLSENGVVTTTLTIAASEDGISRLLWVMSPDKLQHVA
ncbi:RNA polymerase sigma-70 factor [Gryllotalpicola daejeonensis]|uniref:RNA polymerase sigma-70 factor n=2 Tax=Gryllotalpicola daejeonensis TaxID=993087 RepID=A0ABP7ZNU2_9MICO